MDRYDQLIATIREELDRRMGGKVSNISLIDPRFVDFKYQGKFYYAPLSRNLETDAIIIGTIQRVDTGN